MSATSESTAPVSLRTALRQKPLIGILLLAAVLRTGVVWWKYDNLSTDTDSYLAIAHNLIAGEGYCSNPGRPTAYRPPLYPVFVAACLLLGGTFGLAAAQIALGTATCGLGWALARRLGLAEKGCLVAALILAADPLLILYTSHAMTETLVSFVVATLLVTASGAESKWKPVMLGFLFGLAVLCRPSLWAFGGLVAVVSLLVQVRWPTCKEYRWRNRNGILMLAVLLTVSPWAIRNWRVLGRPVFLTTHGGYTLLLANNPVFYEVAVQNGQIWKNPKLAEWQEQLNRQLDEKGVRDEISRDAAMRHMAISNILKSTSLFFRSCILRVFRLWNPVPKAGTVSEVLTIAVAGWYLSIYLLFLAGLFRIRQISRGVVLGLILILSLTSVHAVFWSNARMRAPVMIVVAVLAANSIWGNEKPNSADQSDQTREL